MTEKKVMKLTGYSRQSLSYMRLGRKMGGVKMYAPILIEGVHWEKKGYFVNYTRKVWSVLRKKEE